MNARRRRASAPPVARLVAVAAGLVLVLGACSSSDDSPAPDAASPSASGSASPSAGASEGASEGASGSADPGEVPVAGAFPTYVALGDSFTAAPLASATDPDDPCLRSAENYPALVAQGLGDSGSGFVDRSCSGADTTSLIGVQEARGQSIPAQFDDVTADTSLVTIGIGGNDFGIFSNLVGTCTQLAAQDPTGAPCQAQLTAGGKDTLLADVKKLGGRLTAVVAGIRDRSPDATIVWVGYPASIPPTGSCPDLLPLAAGDYAYAASINKALADTQRKAATRAGVIYIDTYQASLTHDVCSADPWVNGQTTSADTALAYHPLQAEQRAVAAMVLAALADTPAGQGTSAG